MAPVVKIISQTGYVYEENNLVAPVDKSVVHEDYHKMMEFISNCNLKYSMLKAPVIYCEVVEEIWNTAIFDSKDMTLTFTLQINNYFINSDVVQSCFELPENNTTAPHTDTDVINMLKSMGYALDIATAKEINEDNVPLVEETARMKKARLAGLDTRGKATEPIFLRKHKEPMGEASTEGAEGHNAPITAAAPAAAATGAFQPLWGFRRGDTVVGSTKHAWDWSYHSVTPKDFTDVVATPDLERIKLMGAQSLASSNAYFQGAVRQAESWKRASDKADNALRRQQKKYATLEKKLKRKEEELGESNAELVVLRAEKDKAIDNYLDSEEFAQSMRIRDDSVFPEFFRTGWDTALGTVNEACPDINPADYICPDDEALLQRFRTRVVVSDHVPQDPLLPPPESFSRPAEDDSSSSSETTETSSESGEDDDMDAEGTSAP
ncbi:uncharacterized protein LOC141665611 [Apium graveolens]|uniref:uncharacterized protein LOC141665611 n=1 Tax=Apium graveolens TaxID=4045 RepID=UPI003D78EDB3